MFIIDSFCAFYAEYSADSLDDLLGSVHKLQGRLSVSAVKCKLAMPLTVDNTGFCDKTCLGFRTCYIWRITHGNQFFFF